MSIKKLTGTCLFILLASACWAQLPEGGVYGTFNGTRIVSSHTVETEEQGKLQFIIMHRFGLVNDEPLHNLFGLDQSNIRFGFDYGLTPRLSAGFGRSSYQKTYDAYVKYRFMWQRDSGMPISATWLSEASVNTDRFFDPDGEYSWDRRLVYSHQLLLARKFGDRLSLQLMPTFVHRNLVNTEAESNDVWALGYGLRLQVSKAVAINIDGYGVFPGQLAEEFRSPLSVGLSFKTGAHLFQVHLSSSRGMNNKLFITETPGDAFSGDFHLGFNITRHFQLAPRR